MGKMCTSEASWKNPNLELAAIKSRCREEDRKKDKTKRTDMREAFLEIAIEHQRRRQLDKLALQRRNRFSEVCVNGVAAILTAVFLTAAIYKVMSPDRSGYGIKAARVVLPERLTPSAAEFGELSDFGAHHLGRMAQNGTSAPAGLTPEGMFKFENGARYEIQYARPGGSGRTVLDVERNEEGVFSLRSEKSIVPQAPAETSESFD